MIQSTIDGYILLEKSAGGVGIGVMLFFVVTMGMELLQETGRLEIKPHTEHWTSTFGLTQK
jgi:hypothetical protein